MTPINKLVRYRILSDAPTKHGQGTIWRAKDMLFDEEVALKEIQINLEDDPILSLSILIEQFWREARVGARLGRLCPNIVKVSDYGQVDGVPYFAMEWIEGGNLVSQCGHVSLQKAKGMLRQICTAVRIAHQHGIVHSDIAPQNILYDKKAGFCKLADFGFLKVLDSILISLGLGLAGGRQHFMPPEHWLMPNKINKSTDIYALAHTLYALVAGKLLEVSSEGKLKVPNVIQIRHESKIAPDEVRQLLNRFIEGRQEVDSIEDFLYFLDRIP